MALHSIGSATLSGINYLGFLSSYRKMSRQSSFVTYGSERARTPDCPTRPFRVSQSCDLCLFKALTGSFTLSSPHFDLFVVTGQRFSVLSSWWWIIDTRVSFLGKTNKHRRLLNYAAHFILFSVRWLECVNQIMFYGLFVSRKISSASASKISTRKFIKSLRNFYFSSKAFL